EWQRSRRHPRTSRVPADLVIECLVRIQAGGRATQHAVLYRTESVAERYRLVEPPQLILHGCPHGFGLGDTVARSQWLGELVDGLVADIERHVGPLLICRRLYLTSNT